MNNEQNPAFHMLLWDEDEYGYGVSFDPPLIFADFQAAVEAAKTMTIEHPSYCDSGTVFIVPVNLAAEVPKTTDNIVCFDYRDCTYPYVRNGKLFVRQGGKYVEAGT